MIRRRIQITVESDKTLIMRERKNFTKIWCDVCSRQVEMLMLADDRDVMFSEADARRLHVVKTPSGLIFVCLNSLIV
ncbi:MAG: hypothetical protein ACREBG_07890 [Pyrinomonadaceae bacterium]